MKLAKFSNSFESPVPRYVWAGRWLLAASVLAACSDDIGSMPPGDMTAPTDSALNGMPGGEPLPGINSGSAPPVGSPSVTGPGGMSSSSPSPSTTDTTSTAPSVMPTAPPPFDSGCEPGIPSTSQIPRLTNAQYDRTLRDLLGVTELASGEPPSSLLATEQAGDLTSLAWSGYQKVGADVAKLVMADPTLTSNFMKCTPSGDGSACLNETITEFGRRAYRRPLSPEEIADFQELVEKGPDITPTGAANEIAEVLLNAFLVSPSFLQRAEIAETADGSGNFTLSNHEVASRLSYMLWGTTPDLELSEAADNDQLSTKEQILAQAQRLAADPQALNVAADFHRTYLHITTNSRWDTTRKDEDLYPQFQVQGIVPDLVNETEALFSHVYKSGGSFQDLFTTDVAFVTERTAPLYGLNPADYGPEPQEVKLDATARPGFLTRAAFLSAYASGSRPSPILRGAFITKEILGINPGMPDPSVAQTPLPTGPGLDTNRKQVTEMTKNKPCSSCHETFVNPPGFVLEAYDAVGTVQTHEGDVAIDTVADVRFSDTGEAETIRTPAELMARLAAAPAAQRYYAEKWVGYAFDRALTAPDKCTVDVLGQRLSSDGYSIQGLLTDLTQIDYFRVRALEETP